MFLKCCLYICMTAYFTLKHQWFLNILTINPQNKSQRFVIQTVANKVCKLR